MEILVDGLVSVGQTIFATGHLRHAVTIIDKPVATRADAYESVEEICNDIRRKSTVSVESMPLSSHTVNEIVRATADITADSRHYY